MKETEVTRLAILAQLAEEPAHGYALVCRLSPDKKGTGAIYRSLRALEDDGVVESTWATPEVGPARRVYSLTYLGRERLVAERRGLHDHVKELSALLKKIPRVVS